MPHENNEKLRQKVDRFLSDFIKLTYQTPCDVKKHLKNTRTMTRLGFTNQDCVDVLRTLTSKHYYKGPIKDKQHPGNYWEFGIKVEGELIYIKIKIASNKSGDEWPVCYSFHDPEFPMSFPLS
jgi:hypothetical protein